MTRRKESTWRKNFRWFHGGVKHSQSQMPNVSICHSEQFYEKEETGSRKPCVRLWVSQCSKSLCLFGFFSHVYNAFNKKRTNRFEFTRSWLLCSANKSSSWLITPLCPLWTWPLLLLNWGFTALSLIKSVPNRHGLRVQSENSWKDSFSESSNFNNCSLSLLVELHFHTLSCYCSKPGS